MQDINNTRFSPSLNGHLHIGHVYLCLLNRSLANKVEGRFIVRFEDTIKYWAAKFKEKCTTFQDSVKEDLDWLSIKVDAYSSHTQHQERMEPFLAQLVLLEDPVVLKERPMGAKIDYADYYVAPRAKIAAGVFESRRTAERVICDFIDGCKWIIRGCELICEYSLYLYICRILKLPLPFHYYVNKLVDRAGEEICKTEGQYQIKELRKKGVTPKEIRSWLESSCLINPHIGWEYHNVKKFPRLIDVRI